MNRRGTADSDASPGAVATARVQVVDPIGVNGISVNAARRRAAKKNECYQVVLVTAGLVLSLLVMAIVLLLFTGIFD